MRQSRSNEHVQQKTKKNTFHSVKEDEILASFKKMEQFEKDEDLRSGKIINFHEKYLDQLMKREYVRGFRMAEVLLFEAITDSECHSLNQSSIKTAIYDFMTNDTIRYCNTQLLEPENELLSETYIEKLKRKCIVPYMEDDEKETVIAIRMFYKGLLHGMKQYLQ